MPLNKQEAFDMMLAHLRQQGKRAVNPENKECLYRAPDGSKCAVGCLIPDEKYHPKMEGLGPHGLYSLDDNPLDLTLEDARFLEAAQYMLHDRVPDRTFVSELEVNAELFAAHHGLTYTHSMEFDT